MNPTSSTPTSRTRSGLIAGSILILIGAILLAAQFLKPTGWLFFGSLALVFLAGGMLTRRAGLLIPSGVLSGLAIGVYLTQDVYKNATEPRTGGAFFLGLGAGFLLITLFTLLLRAMDVNQKVHLWPLFPAAGLAFFGGVLFTNNLRMLTWADQGWPVILIVIGLYLLLRRRQMQDL